MTPHQRFYTAISAKTPDRIPTLPKVWVDLAAVLTGTPLQQIIEEPVTAMSVIVDACLDIGTDAARLFHLPKRKTITQHDKVFEIDKLGAILGPIDMQGGLATRVTDPVLINLEDKYTAAFIQFWSSPKPLVNSVEEVKQIAIPEKNFYEQIGYGDIQRNVMKKAEGKTAIIGDCGSATLAFHVLLRKVETALFDLVERPDLTHAIMEKGSAHAIEKGKFHIDTGLRILRLNDSVANMSVISPNHWREFIYPHMKIVCDELHSYCPDVRIYCHICGNIIPIIEDLIATGLDCIGPLDPLGGFTCADVRNVVGNRIALMGGVNTLSFLNSTPDELIEEARICIEEAGKTGYILGSGCVVPRSAKKENLIALQNAAEQFGKND